ncbi:MAG: TIGR02680 family protein, partial [Eubacteriales bacterium]|nr:TIGR02680 family protein [Eubacteriales bacterium]
NEMALCDKALLFTGAVKDCRGLEKKAGELEKQIETAREEAEGEAWRYEELGREAKVLEEERDSLSDSDAARLAEQEQKIRGELRELEAQVTEKKRQEAEKQERRLETEGRSRKKAEENEQLWDGIEEKLTEMEEELEGIPFDDFSFLRTELCEAREKPYSFDSHAKLLRDYRQRVEEGTERLREEKACQESYSRSLQELDRLQGEKDGTERELLRLGGLLHETKQDLTEKIYQWKRDNRELLPEAETLQEMTRQIEAYRTETDYWAIRDLAKGALEKRQQEIAAVSAEKTVLQKERQLSYEETLKELTQWKNQREPEPEHEEAVEENRRRLRELGIPFHRFYRLVDFDGRLTQRQAANLEEALLHMGILDALVVPSEYREQVLALDGGVCDRYLFTDSAQVQSNLMELLDIDNEDNDILLFQNLSRALSAIGWKPKERTGSWIGETGCYGMGVLEGTITGAYTPRYIGARARESYRLRRIEELEAQREEQERELLKLQEELLELSKRRERLSEEWAAFPDGKELRAAALECEKREKQIEDLKEQIQKRKLLTEEERKKLDAVRMQVQEICRKCYLTARLDVFQEALRSLGVYHEQLTKLRLLHGKYENGVRELRMLEENLESIDADLDDIRYDLGRVVSREREAQALLASVLEQLKLTDYEKIRERLDYCVRRLQEIPSEKESCVRRRGELETRQKTYFEQLQEKQLEIGRVKARRDWLEKAFSQEYRLGYVERGFVVTEDMEEQAEKVCAMLSGKFGNKKLMDLSGSLQEVYHRNRGALLEYQITLQTLFAELDADTSFSEAGMKRLDISAKYRGTPVKFKELLSRLREDAEVQKRLLSERDRELFEDILANTISKKIRARIQASKRWVDKMNTLMESMRTSSGLTLSLRWKNKRAEKEEQLDTGALVELLQKDAEIMRPEEAQQLSSHFRSKIDEARKAAGETGNTQSFHAIMREVLDYRQWFEFQLECQKTGEKKKELTDRVFFTFSGGEKAMSMYVPLFSAVVAKYAGARTDAPRLISLDEAFAGVDEMNIRDMFRLMVEFEFNFMINSQILWGDYDTVPALAIYQLVRPENARYVTVIRYVWNGNVKRMVTEVPEKATS